MRIANIERHEFDIGERRCRCGRAGAAEDLMAAPGQQLSGCPADAG
jgi:hypothetical protein